LPPALANNCLHLPAITVTIYNLQSWIKKQDSFRELREWHPVSPISWFFCMQKETFKPNQR
jgi:hypothetical protein